MKRRLAAMGALAAISFGGFSLHLIAGFTGHIVPVVANPGAQRVFEASRPAVALIQVDVTLHTNVAEPKLSAAGSRLVASRTGAGGDPASTVDAILSNPAANLAAGPRSVKEDFYLRDSGTGFFVSEDGQMITASHVVARDAADLAAEMQRNFDDSPSISGVDQDLLGRLAAAAPGFQPDATSQAALAAWLPGYLKQNTVVTGSEQRIAVGYGTATISDRLMSAGDHAEVLTAEPPYPGKDVALIKVGIVGAVPALAVSAEESPWQGETSDMIGYGPALDPLGPTGEEPRSPRLETGTVRSYEDRTGFTTYGTDAVSRQGDSGGPLLDADGKVVGMVSYSGTNDSGQSIFGENYFIPASIIREVMAKGKTRPPPTGAAITGRYYRALAAADRQYYRDAVALLEPIHARAPADLEARAALEADAAAISAGRDRTPARIPGSAVGLWIGLLAAALEWALALRPLRPPR
jgi:serine protease Do